MLTGRSKHTSLSLSMESRALSGVKSRLISVSGHSAGTVEEPQREPRPDLK